MCASGALRVTLLCALSAAHALGPASSTTTPSTPHDATNVMGKYCTLLQNLLPDNLEERFLTKRGENATLVVGGGGAAAAAAHALLHALLRHALRYRHRAVLRPRLPAALCALVNQTDHQSENELYIHVAAAWRGETCGQPWRAGEDCAVDANQPMSGARLALLGAGAVPAARRLLARLAPAAPRRCASQRDWAALADHACLFHDTQRFADEQELPSDWPQCTCEATWRGPCVPVLVVPEGDAPDDAGTTRRLLQELCARAAALPTAPPLRLVAVSDAALRRALRRHDRSFLFLDYDVWSGTAAAERVRRAPPLPCANATATCDETLDPTVSLTMAESGQLRNYAPAALGLLRRFKPSMTMIRGIMDRTETLGLEEAACEAAVATDDVVREWLSCRNDTYIVRVYLCGENRNSLNVNVTEIIMNHWRSDKRRTPITLEKKSLAECDDTVEASKDLQKLFVGWKWVSHVGLVAPGAAGAGLAAQAGKWNVPLVLTEAPARAPRGRARVVSGTAPPLARALRRLLAHCGWKRVALLREEGRTNDLDMAHVVASAAGAAVHEQALDAARPGDALDALQALDARVLVLSAGAALAQRVLQLAHARRLTPSRGYAWLVLGAAGDDWRPPPGFDYITLSSWWRGGAAPSALGGQAALRAELDAALGARWPPLFAPLVDALLLTMTTVDDLNMHADTPLFHDLHSDNFTRLFYERFDNVAVEGVSHALHRTATPPIFVHRWNATGGDLLAAWWGGPADLTEPGLCAAVSDGPVCHTTRSGGPFVWHCHDVAWAVLACTLAIAPPALCAACQARRARLQRRDRELEERLLATGGQSAAAAAVTAALAVHAVPRASLELLDVPLGEGQFGKVSVAVLRADERAPIAVAAKEPVAHSPADAEIELLREAALLASLKHEHVVRLKGVCFEGPPIVLMEYAFYGDLQRYLRVRRPVAERARAGLAEPEAAHVAAAALTRLAREAAAALGYLALGRVLHRDVRAANCLVDKNRSLKLADFGMARRLDEPEYLCRRRAVFPVLWMAPESLTRGVFSSASDVWALGVLLLELVTLGARPYGAWRPARVVQHVRAGGEPWLPRDAAPSTRGVTAACWRRAPEERPTAAQLVAYLAAHPRALQPALALEPAPQPALALEPAPGGATRPRDENLYLDEWTA